MKQLRSLRPLIGIVTFASLLLGGCASEMTAADDTEGSATENSSPSLPVTEAPPAAPIAPVAAVAPPVQPEVDNTPVPALTTSSKVEEPLLLKPEHPESYVVTKGDTLWDISNHFLRDPWRWPELWENNPQVRNPHRIFPGDKLVLVFVDGKPALRVQSPSEAPVTGEAATQGGDEPNIPVVRLSPQIREEALERGVPTIPLTAIEQFLSRPRVVGATELDGAPYIISSSDEHLIAGAGHRVYVRGLTDLETRDYVVVRRGQAYRNPENRKEVLGYEAIYVADARVDAFGDPATVTLIKSQREVLNGDRLYPVTETASESYQPHAPSLPINGQIIAVVDGVSRVGQYQIVVLNRGLSDGMERGHVLAVQQSGDTIRDYLREGEAVRMPDERAGTLMVFRVFSRLSYALVMDSTRPILLYDAVTNP